MNICTHAPQRLCQNESIMGHHRYLPRVVFLAAVLREHFVEFGFFQSVEWFMLKFYERAVSLTGLKRDAKLNTPGVADEILNLQPGELVEVKAFDEIATTLDGAGKHKGLIFSEELREYCGRRMRVFKRVERICLESRPGELRKLKNTVLLEGSICHGRARGCDRAAFLFWRECWLKRVDPGGADRPDA